MKGKMYRRDIDETFVRRDTALIMCIFAFDEELGMLEAVRSEMLLFGGKSLASALRCKQQELASCSPAKKVVKGTIADLSDGKQVADGTFALL